MYATAAPTADASVEAIVDGFFQALERGDRDAVAALYADDLAVWHSHDGETQGKAANLRTLGWMSRTGRSRYHVDERVVAGDRVAQRHRLEFVSHDGTRTWSCDVAIFLTVRDGLIHRIDEYVDAEAVRRLVGQFG